MSVMTSLQYRRAIDALGLSQVEAAAFFGVSDRQSRRWALGEAKVRKSVAMLLRLMIKTGTRPEDLE